MACLLDVRGNKVLEHFGETHGDGYDADKPRTIMKVNQDLFNNHSFLTKHRLKRTEYQTGVCREVTFQWQGRRGRLITILKFHHYLFLDFTLRDQRPD